jgi:hypothetical protein
MQPHLQSSKINPEEAPPLAPQCAAAQPAIETTNNKSLAHIILIEDDRAAPPTGEETIIAKSDQKNEEQQQEAEAVKEELHNNDNDRQQLPSDLKSAQKEDKTEPTTTINTASHNNNNPAALSTAAAGVTAPTLAPEEQGGPEEEQEPQQEEEEQHEDGHRPKLHHLTRHWLPPEDRGNSAIEHMGASSVKEAEQKIRGMSQKELRACFQKVYGTPTSSFNNNWLRRKLYEAVGVAGTASTKRYRRLGRNDAAARKRELQRVANAEADAEAAESLAELAAGPSCGGSDVPAESSSR